MIKFEAVNRFKDIENDILPTRKTAQSAGYDFIVAEDVIIPSYFDIYHSLHYVLDNETSHSLEQVSKAINKHQRPTLVSSGVKCALEPNTYLELSVRSSTPLKHWLILANSVGIIDVDYYNNPDNEGEIFFQLINLSPWPIELKRGDRIGQGIIKEYKVTDNDNATGERVGGFGSTSNPVENLTDYLSTLV